MRTHVMSDRFASGDGIWITPKFAMEIGAAAILTLGAIALVVRYTGAPPAPAVKLSMQAEPLKPAPAAGDQATVEFMERFALSRVATPAPEPATELVPVIAPAGATAIAARTAPAPAVKDKPKPVVTKGQPAPTPVSRAVERAPVRTAEISSSEPPSSLKKPSRIPILSDIAEKIPTGRDIANGVTSFGRKVGSIFSRG